MIMNKETLNELLKELLRAVVMDDKKMKDLDQKAKQDFYAFKTILIKRLTP